MSEELEDILPFVILSFIIVFSYYLRKRKQLHLEYFLELPSGEKVTPEYVAELKAARNERNRNRIYFLSFVLLAGIAGATFLYVIRDKPRTEQTVANENEPESYTASAPVDTVTTVDSTAILDSIASAQAYTDSINRAKFIEDSIKLAESNRQTFDSTELRYTRKEETTLYTDPFYNNSGYFAKKQARFFIVGERGEFYQCRFVHSANGTRYFWVLKSDLE